MTWHYRYVPQIRHMHKISNSIAYELCSMLDASTSLPMVRVMLAISGGKDSVSLLASLAQASECNTRYELFGGYVNHRMQELQAQECEFETVRTICSSFTVPLYSVSLCNIDSSDVVSEAFLREKRYKALCDMAQSCKIDYIVTAHHQNDVYENVLMRLFMHGAWQGLVEIPKIRKIRHGQKDIFILRPAVKILPSDFHVQDILHHTDASNVNNRYKRNALRNEIIPIVEKHFPHALQRITAFAHDQSQLRIFTEATIPSWLMAENHIALPFSLFQNLSYIQQNLVLYRGANALGISHVSHAFLEECRKSLLLHMNSIRIKNTVLMKCGRILLWKTISHDLENEDASYCTYKKEQFHVQSCVSLSYTSRMWSVTTAEISTMKDCLVYVLPSVPPLHIAFLKKSDLIIQGNRKLNILSMLKNTCSDIWRNIPVIYDAEGILCVAGETFLQRTFCRFYEKKNNAIDDTMRLCTITIAYHSMELVISS